MTMRIFVAGATGVIGRRLIGLLLEDGHEVTAMTRREPAAAGLQAAGARPVVVDALDAGAVASAVAQARSDVLIHQLTDLSGGTLATNAELRRRGTRNLVDAALAAGVRRVIAQSIAWAYEPGEAPADETAALDLGAAAPRDVTIGGVAALEGAVAEAPEWVVLRYGLLYGPGTWYAPDGLVAERARKGELPAGADVASFLHADDAAVAAVEALTWPSGAVNVCDDEPAPGYEWVPAFCRAVGAGAPPRDDAPRAPWARGASNRHAREVLGWAPRYASWRAGFETLISSGHDG
jgi:nucleoside-diphosphate-sugar epimerase